MPGPTATLVIAALIALGARPVAIGALIILGNTARPYFAADNLAIESIARLANELWKPAACPLCAAGMPLSSPSAAG